MAAITVLLLVLASLLVSGCTNSTSTATTTPTLTFPIQQQATVAPAAQETPISTPIPTTGHNSILESAASELMKDPPVGSGWMHYGKKVTWNGDNSVTVIFIEKGNIPQTQSAAPLAANITLTVFSTTQDATKYIDSIDKSHYLWSDRPFDKNDSTIPAAIRALGTPSVYQNWYYVESTPIQKFGNIYQLDNIVQVDSNYALSAGGSDTVM